MRLAFVVVVLLAVFVFRASGSTLVVLRIARIAVVALVVLGAGWIARRR
jgi:hypothetical protein